MYFIFASFWTFMVYYYAYGFMLLVLIVLIIVTVCMTILGTYFLLNARTIIGNGLQSSRLLPLLYMSTYMLYITIMQRLGCLVSSSPAFTLATLLCSALVSVYYVVL